MESLIVRVRRISHCAAGEFLLSAMIGFSFVFSISSGKKSIRPYPRAS